MSIESKVYFTSRLEALGLADLTDSFERAGWTTVSTFAFAANYAPGRADETPFIKEVVIPLLKKEDDPRKAILRRLFMECYTLMCADMQRRAERPAEDARPAKLPAVEREDRLSLLQKELKGLNITGSLEPSNLLVDKFTEMWDTGEIKYINWEEYTKRSSEVTGGKKDDWWKEDADGKLKRMPKDAVELLHIKDLLNLKGALQRRGVAMNLARLLTFGPRKFNCVLL